MTQESIDVDLRHLLSAVADNDSYAFSLFYDIYYKNVFKVAYYLVRDKELCQEVVSNVFVSIWRSRACLREIEKIEAYLYVVTKNEAHRFLKTRAKAQTISTDELKISITNSEDQADAQIIYREIEALLLDIINELPEKCRIIFMMNRDAGLSTKEIASKLAISENTVRVQMKLAVDKIVSRIKQLYPNTLFTVAFSLIVHSVK